MKIAFIGLGSMGLPMATNLLEAGHDLIVYNRTRSRAENLAKQGARVAGSPREAAAGVEVLITMLADDSAVESMMFGDQGALAGLSREAIHASMSTIGHALSRRLERGECGAGGVGYRLWATRSKLSFIVGPLHPPRRRKPRSPVRSR